MSLALIPLALVAWLVTRWILPHVTSPLRPAVLGYVMVIMLMVAAVTGAVAGGASPLFLVAAFAFWTNDILVARDRFIMKRWTNRVIGLPLYYTAMVLFALLHDVGLQSLFPHVDGEADADRAGRVRASLREGPVF